VLFDFPHPDDEMIWAGTIAKMKQAGWSVNLLTLTQGLNAQNKAMRKSEWPAAGEISGYDNMVIHDFLNNSWEAILGDSIRFGNENQGTLKAVIKLYIQAVNPNIIVTYDDIIGGYRHPEHQITAKIVYALLNENQVEPPFNNLQLLQLTLSPDLEHFLLHSLDTYQQAKSKSQASSLLLPVTIFVDIVSAWPIKTKAGNC